MLLFIDEPALCLDVPKAVSEEQRLSALAVIFDSARIRGASAGLHYCAARPFECPRGPGVVFANRHARAFLDEGGNVAYGLVPTLPKLGAIDSVPLFARWLAAASLAGDPQELAQRAMVTATCGLGLLGERSVADWFSTAQGVGKLIRRLACTFSGS